MAETTDRQEARLARRRESVVDRAAIERWEDEGGRTAPTDEARLTNRGERRGERPRA